MKKITALALAMSLVGSAVYAGGPVTAKPERPLIPAVPPSSLGGLGAGGAVAIALAAVLVAAAVSSGGDAAADGTHPAAN